MRGQTPMLQQYYRAKETCPDALLAMRVGDFYEFYGADAEAAAATLEITLTGREDGSNGRIPMAGVPFHAVEKYLARLVQAGHKVALCDQVEDPKKAKGLVRREVTRVLSAGTLLEDSMLDAGQNNFLAALCIRDGKAGLATLDPSTGEFLTTEIDGDGARERLLQELARLMPAELLASEDEQETLDIAQGGLGIVGTLRPALDTKKAESVMLDHFDVANLAGFGIDDKPTIITAAAMVLNYAKGNGLNLQHVDQVGLYSIDGFLRIDPSSRRSLELTQNLADGSRKNTLLSILDATVTSMGARLLRSWIEQPLLDKAAIESRQNAVARLADHVIPRGDLRDALKKVADIERLVARCASGLASPRDVSALRASLEALPEVDNALRKVALEYLKTVRDRLDLHTELADHLRKAIVLDAPLTLRDGGVVRDGFDMELDKLRDLARDGKGYIARLEQQEREATGIDKLKVGYNSVFGYYLEIGKQYADRVPEHYVRKQTTANAERYITAELKDHESAVLGAEEKAVALEAELFDRLKAKITAQSATLLKSARAIAELDTLASLAEVALRRRYVRPTISDEDVVHIEDGRHPVVDANVGGFVPNGLSLGTGTRLMVLTGPNMSGKSTFLRQAALIQVMAQIGSFVPAKSCTVGLCDRVFTRIGAKDEIALGQSTFMVEMVEAANILNNSTERSLVILDEIGRGTSTYDGLAIAWAMVEHLASIGAKTLFATHYHQLNAVADTLEQVANFRVSVQEVGDRLVWTHRVLPGGTDRSYGLHVAKMAGVPPSVVQRATDVLAGLEGNEPPVQAMVSKGSLQMTLFEPEKHAVVSELADLDVERLTPMEALLKLDEWKRKV